MPKAKPDQRLDWRDPDMPVLLKVRNGNCVWFTSDEAHQAAEQRMHDPRAPNWHNDPTYNLRRKRP